MRKLLLLALLLIAVSGLVASFQAELETVDRTASAEDSAIFQLEVKNNYSFQDRFRISSILSPPVTTNWFRYEYSKQIESSENDTFRITITPAGNPIQQNYAFTVNARSFNGGELRKINTYFTVRNRYDLKFDSFQLSDSEAKPGDTVNVSTTVENTASSELESFSVELEAFNTTKTREGAVLGSGDSIRYNLRLDVPENAEPDNETVKMTIFNEGSEAQTVSQPIKIQEVVEISRKTEADDRLLFNTYSVTVSNSGNVAEIVSVNRSLPVYLHPLASFDPAPDNQSSSAGSQNYYWDLTVNPNEEEKISYTVDYTPAIGFVVLLFLGIIGLKKFQTDIKVSKDAKVQEDSIKIRIELENNSGTDIRDLVVKDFVPDIAEVSDKFDMASPVKTKTNSGTRLKWEIDNLSSDEQRVFEYKIKPLVEVEGGVTLSGLEIEKNGKKLKETGEIDVEFKPE